MKEVVVFWSIVSLVNGCLIVAAFMLGMNYEMHRCTEPAGHVQPPVMRQT